MSEWQPIETAPFDERNVLVYWDMGCITMEDFAYDSNPQRWAERGATHWMPLPEPPR